MPGIIESSLSLNGKNPFQNLTTVDAPGANPTLAAIDPVTDTVGGQMQGILAKDNPYITRARAAAADVANSRGLQNTTMGAQSGEAAAIDAALPIAQADAGIFSQQRLANQGVLNTSALSSQQAGQTSKLQSEGAEQAKELSAQGATQAKELQAQTAASTEKLQAAQLQSQQLMQQADNTNKIALTNIEADYKTLMQVSSSASDIYKNAMTEMTKIMADPNMDAASKQTALNNQLTILKSGMNLIGSANGVDLTALLPTG